MKFKPKKLREVRSIFAFLPKKCICCGEIFWLEKGWYRYLGRDISVYCCNKCAKNKEEAQTKCVIKTERPQFQPVRPKKEG